jgi:hypothetical protein
MRHYPHISAICKCTICLCCVNRQMDAATATAKKSKGYIVECPLCQTEKAWDTRPGKSVPNIALATFIEELRRLRNNLPEE